LQQTVRGKVTSTDGTPISGATVSVKGTSISTKTNDDGTFQLSSVTSNALLTVSYIGYQTLEIQASTTGSMSIRLEAGSTDLEAVVVVGFGTQKKENLTGAVASIQMTDVVESRPITSLSA